MVTLVTIAAGHSLAPAPAASYERMRAAGCPPGITSSYRSSEEQARLRALYLAGQGAFALPPGTSQHERGYALDLKSAAAAWVRAHPEHGWRFTNKSEWWHVDYFIVADIAAITTAPAQGGAVPEEDFMAALTDDEQRRMLGHLDTLGTWLPDMKVNIDRLKHIQSQADTIAAATTNITNGVVELIGRAPSAAGSALTDADLARIAKAVADEQARRMQS